MQRLKSPGLQILSLCDAGSLATLPSNESARGTNEFVRGIKACTGGANEPGGGTNEPDREGGAKDPDREGGAKDPDRDVGAKDPVRDAHGGTKEPVWGRNALMSTFGTASGDCGLRAIADLMKQPERCPYGAPSRHRKH